MEPEKNLGGRPRKEINWSKLDDIIIWASQQYCAEQLDVSVDTLARAITERFDMGFAEYKDKRREPLKINLLVKQYEVAMRGNVAMLIWLGKQHLGQAEKVEEKKNSNIQISITPDDANL
jgi:hypothetical protein